MKKQPPRPPRKPGSDARSLCYGLPPRPGTRRPVSGERAA